jgi:hypothetical protein
MGPNDERKAPRLSGEGAPESLMEDRFAPRSLTFAENLKLTIKVLAGSALLIASLWGLSVWKAAE